jgi:hypothetical protein
MVKMSRTESGKRIDERWHRFRENARRTAVDEAEFAPSDRIHYNLDTARITGKEYPETFQYSRPLTITLDNTIDVRDLRNR